MMPTSGGTQTFSATGGGDISFVATSSSGMATAIEMNYANIYANGGNITIDAGAKGIQLGYATGTAPTVIGGSTSSAKAGTVKVIADNYTPHSATTVTYQNAGSVYIEPKSASFSASQTIAAVNSFSTIGYLSVGKSGNTATVAWSEPTSIDGNVDFYGGALTINSNITTTTNGNITMTGSGNYTGAGALFASGY